MATRRGKTGAHLVAVDPHNAGQVSSLARPAPPPELTEEQSEEWQAIVDRLPPTWFPRETWGLLVQYCRHLVAARRIAQLIQATEEEEDLKLARWLELLKAQEAEGRAMSSLATRLRMTQQATRSAKEQKPAAVRKPWEDD